MDEHCFDWAENGIAFFHLLERHFPVLIFKESNGSLPMEYQTCCDRDTNSTDCRNDYAAASMIHRRNRCRQQDL